MRMELSLLRCSTEHALTSLQLLATDLVAEPQTFSILTNCEKSMKKVIELLSQQLEQDLTLRHSSPLTPVTPLASSLTACENERSKTLPSLSASTSIPHLNTVKLQTEADGQWQTLRLGTRSRRKPLKKLLQRLLLKTPGRSSFANGLILFLLRGLMAVWKNALTQLWKWQLGLTQYLPSMSVRLVVMRLWLLARFSQMVELELVLHRHGKAKSR